jgi:hypothetical protein
MKVTIFQNPKKIEKVKAIVSSSTTETTYTFEEKRLAEVTLREIIDNLLKDSPSSTPSKLTPSTLPDGQSYILTLQLTHVKTHKQS